MPTRIKTASIMIGAVIFQTVALCPCLSNADAATIVDDVFYESAETSIAVRNVVFERDGARFDSAYAGIDYADESLPVEGTVEILLRASTNGAVLDTRGADLRLPGDLYLGIVSGPYGSSTLQNAVSGQVFFTIDPGPGTNPGLLPGVLSTTILTDGDWHTISVSFGSSGLALFIDGVLEDTAESITVQPINSIVTLGDFADQFVPAAFSFLGEILRFRTSDVQNDVTPLCEGMPTLYVNCDVADILPDIGTGRFLLLDQNAPNPFNPQTTIAFDLPAEQAVSLRVYDVSGRLVDTLLDDQVATAGRNEIVWRGRDADGRVMSAGVYFYRLEAGPYSETKRMVLVK